MIHRRGMISIAVSAAALLLAVVLFCACAEPGGRDGHFILEKQLTAGDGERFLITVACGPDAGIPRNAVLEADEILREEDREQYADGAARALGMKAGENLQARFFDIRVLDAGGNELQPREGARVEVAIRMAGHDASRMRVVHFGAKAEVLPAGNADGALRFETSGFSVYGIVDVPSPLPTSEGAEATFGIAYNNSTTSAAGVLAQGKTVSGTQRMAAVAMKIQPDVLDHDGVLLVAKNSAIADWTFRCVSGNTYHITTQAGGQTKYLTVNGANVTLEDEPGDNSLITATPGTGANSGKWHFTVNGYSLNYSGSAANGFNAARGTGGNTWLNLVERSVLDDDDIRRYSAKKVSVSDTENVYDGQEVVIYTRIWNSTAKKYEFYAVDHDGKLIPCRDTGDGIEWIGTNVNTALWRLSEYFYEGTNTQNNYLDLQNVQYGNYISPQRTGEGGQTDATEPVGINLFGRRYGKSTTTIVAWDDVSYSFAALKTENGALVGCQLSEAQDFCFAIITSDVDPEDTLTEVRTVDNGLYGITMRMLDFNNPLVPGKNRDSVQDTFFNGDNNRAGLLSTNLGDDGYPSTTEATGAVQSLSVLFKESDLQDVNHLFLESIHNESGYFEYDSTQNFARLNKDTGDFTVYDQLGAIGTATGPTRTHGQFMPYNSLVLNKYAPVTNQTNVLAQALSDLDPRKGEKMYLIPQNEADYFFGMEVAATFTQTLSGLDAWGHDIVFDFSGDDDFWLYVDGELVLDLGGVHSAMTGSVNFRTGEVIGRNGNRTTLYNVFKANYQARGLSEDKISEKLDEKFQPNGDGQYVFRDYSQHEMKIFYMERGAGASNLYMRFNLAAVRPGSFVLSKTLSGTENPGNDLIEFAYRIRYLTTMDGEQEWHYLTDKIGDQDSAVYAETDRAVKYLEEFTPADGTVPYENVFFLKPGESAEVTLPDGATFYEVVECGVNPDIFDRVTANGELLDGIVTENEIDGTFREDYATPKYELENQQKVEFDNRVKPGAMRTVSFTKRLFDTDGLTPLHYPDDETVFNLRLYLGSENADLDNLPGADMYDYCVKNAEGYYCRWDTPLQRFVSIGKTDYADLTDADKQVAVFTSSMNGSITKIPADYTVEVRNLIIGTQYKVEERNYEIPKGYTLRMSDGYTRVDTDPEVSTGDTPYAGILLKDEDPEVEVRNQKGWGMTVKKVWTDVGFMEERDDIYFAVYVNTGSEQAPDLRLYEDRIFRYAAGDTELYMFFLDLEFQGNAYRFSDFVIREVMLTDPVVDEATGRVTDFGSITSIEDGGVLTAGGKPYREEYAQFEYTVTYRPGEITGRNENIRTDTVIDSRPGIRLVKLDMDGQPLSGAVFTLTDENGDPVAAAQYTSGEDGLITIAYLPDGVYTLREIAVPKGFAVLDEPVTITVEGEKITISGSGAVCECPDPDWNMIALITLSDRASGLLVRKVDTVDGWLVRGAHFALYRQVIDSHGHKQKDYLPMSGYEDMVTDENGVLEEITLDLPAGTYYLTETEPAEKYLPLAGDLCFTLGADGTVTVEDEDKQDWLKADESAGLVSYILSIPNDSVPTDTVIDGKKALCGRDMKENEFSVSLTRLRVDEHGIAERDGVLQTVGIAAAEDGEYGAFAFEAIDYTIDDYTNAVYRDRDGNALFYYLVEEVVPEDAGDDGITYGGEKFLAVVTLSHEPDGLKAEWKAYEFDGQHIPEGLWPRRGS